MTPHLQRWFSSDPHGTRLLTLVVLAILAIWGLENLRWYYKPEEFFELSRLTLSKSATTNIPPTTASEWAEVEAVAAWLSRSEVQQAVGQSVKEQRPELAFAKVAISVHRPPSSSRLNNISVLFTSTSQGASHASRNALETMIAAGSLRPPVKTLHVTFLHGCVCIGQARPWWIVLPKRKP